MENQASAVQQWDFFIAHAEPDLPYAEALYHCLSKLSSDARPLHVFLDSRVLKLGDEWDIELAKAQRDSKVTVVLVSANTERAYYEREEISAAIAMAREARTKHRVVPVFIGVDTNTRYTVPYGLRLRHGVAVSEIGQLKAVAYQLWDLISDIEKVPEEVLGRRTAALEEQAGEAVSLKSVAEGTRAGANAIRSFAGLLEQAVTSGLRAIDLIQNRRERGRLRELLRHLMRIEHSQAPLSWLLRRYAQRLRAGEMAMDNWSQVTQALAELTPVVAQVVELLSAWQGDFMIVDHEAYKHLLFGLKGRMRVYAQLGALERPKTQEEIQCLEDIAAEYVQMIADLNTAEKAIVKYLVP